MTLKNNYKKGQAALEYFVLFALIGLLVIISTNALYLSTKRNFLQGSSGKKSLFQRAVDRIAQ